MKQLLSMTTAIVFASGIVGCTHTSETTIDTPGNATVEGRTYSGQDLNRTGKRTSAEQLQAADPSVTTTH